MKLYSHNCWSDTGSYENKVFGKTSTGKVVELTKDYVAKSGNTNPWGGGEFRNSMKKDTDEICRKTYPIVWRIHTYYCQYEKSYIDEKTFL